MIKGIIYKSNNYSQQLMKFIEIEYNKVVGEYGGEPIDVVAYWEFGNYIKPEYGEIPVLDTVQICDLMDKGEIEILLIPEENYAWQEDYLTKFFSIGINLDDIYIAKKQDKNYEKKQDIIDALVPYYLCRKLPYLEFHIADHCNLKCADCEHYSGLVETPVFPDLAKFTKDLGQLKKFFDEITVVRILGGEPLLNPEIEDYIKLVSDIYPDSVIHVVTNGLLLKTMPDSFFDTLKGCREGSGIWISFYPVMRNKIDDIRSFLNSKNVGYGVSDEIKMFRKQQKLNKGDDISTIIKFSHCFQKGCINLYDGKLAACFLPFTTKYFNKYFDKSLPEDGTVDLYEEGLTTEIIRRRISEPFERCRYCMEPVELPWHTIHSPSILEDWVEV